MSTERNKILPATRLAESASAAEAPGADAILRGGWPDAKQRRRFYDDRASFRDRESRRFYPKLLRGYYAFLVPPGVKVLELGCGLGDLLAAVRPSRGVGVDFSAKVIELARIRHPELEFHACDALQFSVDEKFDYVLMSDLVNDLPDVQAMLEHVQRVAHRRTRLIVNFHNNLWQPILTIAEWIGAKTRTLPQNWLSRTDMENLLFLSGWEVIKAEQRILWPINTPIVERFLNRWVAPLLRHLCLTVCIVARPQPDRSIDQQYRCSVIIPARNEAGNIETAVQRMPEIGLGTEIIFIEGHSRDDTFREIERVAAKYSHRHIKVVKQRTAGKGGAVREAFAEATGDILFILDADLTVPPEELTKFYEIARTRRGDFVNGVRLVYPMENEAMRFCNLVANKLFGLSFSWLLGQPIKDTLCGTKVLFREDYQAIAANRNYFGDFDPFGDFDLLFGAAKLNLRIVDLPVRYRARTYGETNIQRWRHGWLLLKMLVFGARRLKFV